MAAGVEVGCGGMDWRRWRCSGAPCTVEVMKRNLGWREELWRRLAMASCFMAVMASHRSENSARGRLWWLEQAQATCKGEVKARA